jgi:hypothetical protein
MSAVIAWPVSGLVVGLVVRVAGQVGVEPDGVVCAVAARAQEDAGSTVLAVAGGQLGLDRAELAAVTADSAPG